MRVIGLDIHRAFAEAVALEDGRLKRLGRVSMRRDLLEKFAAALWRAHQGHRGTGSTKVRAGRR